MSEIINAEQAPEPVGSYPHAKRVGDFLYLSGVGPRKKNSPTIPGVELDKQGKIQSYNIEEQCHSVFNNVKMILESAGASVNHLVDVTVFLTNMQDDFQQYNQIWKEFFGDTPPCRTTVEILSLPTPIAIELKCIAYLGEDK